MTAPPQATAASGDRIGLGIAWMVVTTFFFVCVHSLGKYLVQEYPVWQVVWGRFFFHLLIAAAILGPRLRQVFASQRLGLQFTRSGFMLGASFLYFLGVATVPLAEANAIMFLCPILVVMLSPLILKGTGRPAALALRPRRFRRSLSDHPSGRRTLAARRRDPARLRPF